MSKVEKGQKYNSTGTQNVYEILTDPIKHGEDEYVLFADKYGVTATLASTFLSTQNFTLIREPKFTVGDEVSNGVALVRKVVAVSSETDSDGLFWYIAKTGNGAFYVYDESEIEAA